MWRQFSIYLSGSSFCMHFDCLSLLQRWKLCFQILPKHRQHGRKMTLTSKLLPIALEEILHQPKSGPEWMQKKVNSWKCEFDLWIPIDSHWFSNFIMPAANHPHSCRRRSAKFSGPSGLTHCKMLTQNGTAKAIRLSHTAWEAKLKAASAKQRKLQLCKVFTCLQDLWCLGFMSRKGEDSYESSEGLRKSDQSASLPSSNKDQQGWVNRTNGADINELAHDGPSKHRKLVPAELFEMIQNHFSCHDFPWLCELTTIVSTTCHPCLFLWIWLHHCGGGSHSQGDSQGKFQTSRNVSRILKFRITIDNNHRDSG